MGINDLNIQSKIVQSKILTSHERVASADIRLRPLKICNGG